MITNTMKKFLETEYPKLIRKKGSIKLHVYLGRLQKRIDEQLNMALWLAVNYPNVFLGKMETVNSYGNLIHSEDRTKERLKLLLLVIKALNPKIEVELTKKEPQMEIET